MHKSYLRSILRHKWFVFIEACRLGIPWLGIIHDLSKFSPREFFTYARAKAIAGEGKSPVDIGASEMDRAWMHHARNRHHWQAWLVVYQTQNPTPKALPMPDRYRREMLADWRGAGRAYGSPDTRAWYAANCDRMILHTDTRAWIEEQLQV